MRDLKVGLRLAAAFGLVLALMVVAVTVAFLAIRGGQEQASRLERENLALLNAANAMRVAQLNEAVAIRDFVSLPDVGSQRQAAIALKTSAEDYAGAAAELEALARSGNYDDRLRALMEKVRGTGKRVSTKLREAMDQAEQAEYAQAQAIVYRDARPLQAAVATDLATLVKSANALARGGVEIARADARSSEQRLAAVTALALVLGIAFTLLITRGIVQPLQAAVGAAEQVADGDLRPLLLKQRTDETGRVLAALASMQGRLNTLVRAIRDSAAAVSSASNSISVGNTELAARTEEQAASLEETAASVEELTAIVKQNSDGAGKASLLAREASALAQDSGQAVEGVVITMEGIHQSSRKVSDIVGVIDEIAFKTNLLALNAAVEAARAGEHGRGFAVVAAEVRLLAQRSAEASKEIKQLVSAAVGQAQQGSQAATRAGESMAKVVRVAHEVAQLVSDIARASGEQRAGIEQVNTTIAQMDTATQSNASLVQEINGTIDALLAQAGELVAATSRFRLDEHEHGAAVMELTALQPLAWRGS